MIIQVTQQHIRDATGGASNCPVARAIAEQFPNSTVFVDPDLIEFVDFDRLTNSRPNIRPTLMLKVNSNLGNKICDYDDYGIMEPFTLELDLNAEVAREAQTS